MIPYPIYQLAQAFHTLGIPMGDAQRLNLTDAQLYDFGAVYAVVEQKLPVLILNPERADVDYIKALNPGHYIITTTD